MTRLSDNEWNKEGRLLNGYDYENQCWVLSGLVVRCGHPNSMNCNCYGRLHAGEISTAIRPEYEEIRILPA